MTEQALDLGWAPDACTLPTVEQPLRVAEFDDLFATSARGFDRPEPTRLRITLDASPEVAGRAANLMMRESGCCSFFGFALSASGGELHLDVTVPAAHVDVLDELHERARTA